MENILEMKKINKQFFSVKALDNVDFSVKRGEVHILIGENGAGKSTLMKILSGAYHMDSGTIIFDGEELHISNPHYIQNKGISIIYQEFNLIPEMSIAENIFLGREPKKKTGLIDWKKMREETKDLLNKLEVDVDPKTIVKTLSVAQQQFVEIAKSLSFGAKLIIMDEPSATLTPKEIERLFLVIKELKEHNVSIIYISHHLDEVFQIGDSLTVLRDGKLVNSLSVASTNKNEIIKMMVGRELKNTYPKRSSKPGKALLEIKNLSKKNVLKDIEFTLHEGEILGVAGLVGSGRTEMVRAIFGADSKDSGKITLNGNDLKINSPKDSIKNKIGLLPEDRKRQGVVLGMSVKSNISLASLERVIKRILINGKLEQQRVGQYFESLKIKAPNQDVLIQSLSGGNQQKVVLAKWLFTDCDIFIFDEPTRGIDVGAKYEIYQLMNRLTDHGKAIIMISSEMPEIIGMSDNVIVMHNGEITGKFKREELTQEKIMTSAAGEVN